MYAIRLFEQLADATWHRLADGERLRVRQGETTVTDHLLLELARLGAPEVLVAKTTQDKEDAQGTDWEWWIGRPYLGWMRFAVQAKKLDLDTGRYAKLGHAVGRQLQVSILASYASANSAIPLYCFYNYIDLADYSAYWHCHQPIDPTQLGCTVTPLSVVKQALSVRGGRSFVWIHSKSQTLPWRCILKCPAFTRVFEIIGAERETMLDQLTLRLGVRPVIYSSLPPQLELLVERRLQAAGRLRDAALHSEIGTVGLDPEYYRGAEGTMPKRVAVINTVG